MTPSRLSIAILMVLLLILSPARSSADEIIRPGKTVKWLTAGSVVISAVNVAYMFGDGSVKAGAVGVALGAGLSVASMLDDSIEGDEAGYVTFGAVTAVIGGLDMLRATHGKNDTELLGVRIDPSVRSVDGERFLGLQLSSRW